MSPLSVFPVVELLQSYTSHCKKFFNQLLVYFLIEVTFTQHKINHFRGNNSVAFSIFRMLRNHYLYLVAKQFHQPKRKSHTHLAAAHHSLLLASSNHQSLSSVCMDLSIPDISYHTVLQLSYYITWSLIVVTFCIWLLSLSRAFLWFTHIVADINIVLLFFKSIFTMQCNYCLIHFQNFFIKRTET